jgi:hypothetical protein
MRFASPIPGASRDGWRRLTWLPSESTQSVAVPRVAATMCRREVERIERVAAFGQADDVMRGTGKPVQWPCASEVVVDGSATHPARCAVQLTGGHAQRLRPPPLGTFAACTCTHHLWHPAVADCLRAARAA